MALSRLEYWLTTPISVLWRDIQGGQISRKLVRVFFLQVLAISLAAGAGVWIAMQAIEGLILERSLTEEAAYIWQRRAEDPDYPLPETKSFKTWLVAAGDESALPRELRGYPPGFHRLGTWQGARASIYVSQQDGHKLILLFSGTRLFQASFMIGIAPMLAALAVIYFLTWLGYISSKRALSPLVRLAERVEEFDFTSQKLTALNFSDITPEADIETLSLLRAFEHFTERLQGMIERERMFTRNASHELRTPLAVIKGNLELLRYRADKAETRQHAIDRMQRAVMDMQGLIETLLLLARDDRQSMPEKDVDMPELLENIMQTEASIQGKTHLQTHIEIRHPLVLHAPERVLGIIFSNLLRNAFTYTDEGAVTVTVEQRSVTVVDTGIGMDEEEIQHAFEPFFRGEKHGKEGFGLGLALVSRLCRRYGWGIQLDSEPGSGTTITLQFPEKTLAATTNHPGEQS